MRALAAIVLSLCCAATAGCALLQKSDPAVPRYFSPESDPAPAAAVQRGDLSLRLGRVQGWAHLRERLAARLPAGEISYREDLCWTERPEVFLRRALARALFQERGIVESISGRALTLDVELTAFEVTADPPPPVSAGVAWKANLARMTALVVLRDDRQSLLQQTITVERPILAGEPAQAMVKALSLALRAGVERTADRVVARLDEQVGPGR